MPLDLEFFTKYWLPALLSCLALAGSILSLFISTRLAIKKERRQLRWAKEIERLSSLEEEVGRLVEDLSSYRDTGDRLPQLSSLADKCGGFGRYPKLVQVIRDMHNALARLHSDKIKNDDASESRSDVAKCYNDLIAEIDIILKK